MNPEARADFPAWTQQFEGSVATFYNDIFGYTTIGVGNFCNTVGEAMALPMVRTDDMPATPAEIAAEWHRVHDDPSFARLCWKAAARGATCRLTPDGISTLVLAKMDQMWGHLSKRFPDVETWPAPCQTALLSMSWAAGPAFTAPKFEAAAKAQDWETCALECHFDDTHNPGLRPRNVANARLFQDAARAVRQDRPTEPELVVPEDDAPVFCLPDLDEVKPPPGEG